MMASFATVMKSILCSPKLVAMKWKYIFDALYCDIVYGITDTEIKAYMESREKYYEFAMEKIYKNSIKYKVSYRAK